MTAEGHCYVTSVERREEAGTPNIVGDIKTGLVLELQARVGAREIERRETEMVARAMRAWAQEPNIELLGPLDAERIGVFALNIRCGAKKLHYGLVVALLNDLFGIQARGGCSCAGPYGHDLLGIDGADALRHQQEVHSGRSVLRPGWVRLGFNYFFDERTTDYLIEAVRFVAAHGAAFMSLYKVNPSTGVWSVASGAAPAARPASLFEALDGATPPAGTEVPGFAECLAIAQDIAQKASTTYPCNPAISMPEQEDIRWFWLPHEAAEAARSENEDRL